MKRNFTAIIVVLFILFISSIIAVEIDSRKRIKPQIKALKEAKQEVEKSLVEERNARKEIESKIKVLEQTEDSLIDVLSNTPVKYIKINDSKKNNIKYIDDINDASSRKHMLDSIIYAPRSNPRGYPALIDSITSRLNLID